MALNPPSPWPEPAIGDNLRAGRKPYYSRPAEGDDGGLAAAARIRIGRNQVWRGRPESSGRPRPVPKGLKTMTTRATTRAFSILGVSLGLSLALGLGGCSTMTAGRDRIVVKAAPRCTDQTVQIYFEQFSAQVTKEGRAVLAAAAAESKPCKIVGVDILGLADNVGGTPDSNLDLSKRRAEAVTSALASVGLPAGEFKITALGQTGSTTTDGRSKPLRRRADIVLHLSPS